MPFEPLMKTVNELLNRVETLASIGALLRLEHERREADPAIAASLQNVLAAIDPQLLDDLEPEQRLMALSVIDSYLRQAADLLTDPARPPGWSYTDPVILKAQGNASMGILAIIKTIAPALPGLTDAMARPGARFLDVGSGVGGICIAACRTFPEVSVVGLDPHEPAMRHAEEAIREAGLAERVELRRVRCEDIADVDTFDMVWLPGPFLPEASLLPACRTARRALKPGGWAFLGLYGGAPDPLAQALNDLRIVRSGGALLDDDEACRLLGAAGFADVRAVERTWASPMRMVVGRR